MQINVEVKGLGAALKAIGVDVPKQVNYATMVALSRTASKVRDRQYSEMHRVFDRPTPYTLNALRVKPATKSDLSAWVGFKEAWAPRAAKYMPVQVEGGQRRMKGFEFLLSRAGKIGPNEYLIPARGCPLNTYGNVSPGLIQKILSGLQAHTDVYANTTKASRARSKSDEWYFVTRAGIWRRKGKTITLLFVRTARAPQYKSRYPFYEISKRFIEEIWHGEFERAFAEAIATAK